MNIIAVVLISLHLFLPFIQREGTNVSVLANSSCGPRAGVVFELKFKNGGQTLTGVTDSQGKWKGVGPSASYVEYKDSFYWFGKTVEGQEVKFHSFVFQENC